MTTLDFTEDELLESDPPDEPLVVAGTLCHGGLRSDGTYISPRTAVRTPAIRAWQEHHTKLFRCDLLEAPIEAWPAAYPNVAQAKLLIRNGVRDPIIAILTRIGTVEGFGAALRNLGPGRLAPADLQTCFEEDIRSTATCHLGRGLIEAHARDEAGWGPQAGHDKMWFAVRDSAFEYPVTPDQTELMLTRMGIQPPAAGSKAPPPAPQEERLVEAIHPGLEALLRTMTSVLFIEVRAFHLFAWAEELLADTELVAGEGLPARLVSYIRQDETPHVEYLRTALSEMRDRTFIGTNGKPIAGSEVIGKIWDHHMRLAHEVREPQTRATYLAEVQNAVSGRSDEADLLAEFHSLENAA
ncbi:MAG: hypothetical protein WAM97_20685 [Acidimicrobiales bacterium]